MPETDQPPETGRQPSVRPVDLRDYADFDDDAARRVRVLTTDRLALDLWCLQPQQATPVLHHEDADATYTVIGGHSWFVTDEGEIGLDPMGALLVPAGVVHGIDNRAADPLVVVASLAPPGEAGEDPPVAGDRTAVRDDAESGLAAALRRGLGRLLGERPPDDG